MRGREKGERGEIRPPFYQVRAVPPRHRRTAKTATPVPSPARAESDLEKRYTPLSEDCEGRGSCQQGKRFLGSVFVHQVLLTRSVVPFSRFLMIKFQDCSRAPNKKKRRSKTAGQQIVAKSSKKKSILGLSEVGFEPTPEDCGLNTAP